MDTPPIPKPRTGFLPDDDPKKRPVPLPRTKLPTVNNNNSERVTASDIFRSISTVSKQITEDVASKVQTSAKSANEKIEKSLVDSTRMAKDKLEKTINTSRAMRDSVTRSVIEGTKTASMKLRRSKKASVNVLENNPHRCVSMPVNDISLFDNIQFHSPLLEQKKYKNDDNDSQNQNKQDFANLNLSSMTFDDLSLFSNNSDSNVETASTVSHDSRDNENSNSNVTLDVYDSPKCETYDTPKTMSRANSISHVIPITELPEVPERRKKREGSMLLSQQEFSYENWTLPSKLSLEKSESLTQRASKSTIYEFDPLNTSAPKFEGQSNELLLLQSFLVGDMYGTVVSNDNNEDSIDYFDESDYFNPPTPPERSDSLFPDNNEFSPPKDANKSATWFVKDEDDTKPPVEEDTKMNSVRKKFSNMLKFDNVLNKSSKQATQKLEIVPRPPVSSLPASFYTGILTRIVSGVDDFFKNSQLRYCMLSEQKLACHADPKYSVLKEEITFDSILSIQIILPLSSSTTENSYCFELTVCSGTSKNAPRKMIFSCNNVTERRTWGQKIVENLAQLFPTKYTAEFTRCGWCYLKEGVSGEWQGAWVMLIRRVLLYYTTKDTTIKNVDLRKTRCVVTQAADDNTKAVCCSDGSPNLVLDCPHATLYLRFANEKELKGWRGMVKLAAHNNGAYIHHQQLTKEDVPAIVDKCISFLYAHGSMTEGIYRRAGSNSVLTELLSRFRRDAWSVQLSPVEHSEHDVAGVLKRFFRDLPEPLICRDLHQQLIGALEIDEKLERHAVFSRLMVELPQVARNTARKLFAHLHFLQSMAHVNKMSAENLASVWTPTVMPGAMQTNNAFLPSWSSKELMVIRELIIEYESIWEPTENEKRRDAAVRRVLMRVLSHSAPAASKAAGDLRTWVYVKDKNTCYQIALTPSKTSSDVCIELCEKAGLESHLLMLEEVICSDSMKRMVHVDEVVLDVVLRWGYWDEDDRRDNYLLIKENKILHELDSLRSTTSLVCGELKFASESSKAFKLHMFEFQNMKLCYFKDKQGSHQIDEWHIKDILWYVGHEPKRNPQTRWAITFIPRNNKPKRSKDRPWFGCTIAGAVTEDQARWMTAMLFAEHANILPTPRLVIT